jgi:hypothetical protein
MSDTPDTPPNATSPVTSDRERIAAVVNHVKQRLRITKVVATRSVKTAKGDFFSGFSAAWDSVQDDHGSIPDADLNFSDGETAVSGMTLEESRVAHVLLSMEASIAAWRAAHAEGVVSEKDFNDRKTALRRSHSALLTSILSAQAQPPTPSK